MKNMESARWSSVRMTTMLGRVPESGGPGGGLVPGGGAGGGVVSAAPAVCSPTQRMTMAAASRRTSAGPSLGQDQEAPGQGREAHGDPVEEAAPAAARRGEAPADHDVEAELVEELAHAAQRRPVEQGWGALAGVRLASAAEGSDPPVLGHGDAVGLVAEQQGEAGWPTCRGGEWQEPPTPRL